MTLKLADDCFVLDKDRLPHGEALAILKSRVRPVVEMEEVTLESAAGRYLAEAIVAPRPIPAHDNAAVDGFSLFASMMIVAVSCAFTVPVAPDLIVNTSFVKSVASYG